MHISANVSPPLTHVYIVFLAVFNVNPGGGPENEPDMADLRGSVYAIWAHDRFGGEVF